MEHAFRGRLASYQPTVEPTMAVSLWEYRVYSKSQPTAFQAVKGCLKGKLSGSLLQPDSETHTVASGNRSGMSFSQFCTTVPTSLRRPMGPQTVVFLLTQPPCWEVPDRNTPKLVRRRVSIVIVVRSAMGFCVLSVMNNMSYGSGATGASPFRFRSTKEMGLRSWSWL